MTEYKIENLALLNLEQYTKLFSEAGFNQKILEPNAKMNLAKLMLLIMLLQISSSVIVWEIVKK